MVKHVTEYYITTGKLQVITAPQVRAAIDRKIEQQSAPDAPQQRYSSTEMAHFGDTEDTPSRRLNACAYEASLIPIQALAGS